MGTNVAREWGRSATPFRPDSTRVRAVDVESGDVLWKAQVDAPAVANPGTYVYKGRQYVVFVAGGNAILKPQVSDQVVAYALPARTG